MSKSHLCKIWFICISRISAPHSQRQLTIRALFDQQGRPFSLTAASGSLCPLLLPQWIRNPKYHIITIQSYISCYIYFMKFICKYNNYYETEVILSKCLWGNYLPLPVWWLSQQLLKNSTKFANVLLAHFLYKDKGMQNTIFILS